MAIDWLAIGFTEVAFIMLAFAFGLVARMSGLPPLVGFLAAGFALGSQDISDHTLILKLSDLGITLLLFTIGLKLNLRTFSRPQVWAVGSAHMVLAVLLVGVLLLVAGLYGLAFFSGLHLKETLIIAFALSFSSTVFVAKTLEDRSQDTSLHGRIAIGILLIQDVAAVVFMVIAAGAIPSPWALLLLLLFPLRILLLRFLDLVGHGELLVLYGFLLALGGAEFFELLGLKGDLGALVFGVVIASHPKAEEVVKAMLGFKDLFLLGFFLSIGLSGSPAWNSLPVALLCLLILPFKSALFFILLTRFRLRARTSLLTSLNLTNYSEFGLIVVAVAVGNQWIDAHWLAIISIALSMSFIISSVLNANSEKIYLRYREFWQRYQRSQLAVDDRMIDFAGSRVVILGMGGVGTGAYDALRAKYGDIIVGVDIDPVTVRNQVGLGRNVLRGDPTAPDFWERVATAPGVALVMLALPKIELTLDVLARLRVVGFNGEIAATARFSDEEKVLKSAGVDMVFNVYAEAGADYAEHASSELKGFAAEAR